jgi:hypothetical protein
VIVATDSRRTILVVDGEPEDQAGIVEAARATGCAGSRLLVLFVPVSLAEWAHWELGDNPLELRQEIEWEQYRMIMRMLREAGFDDDYEMKHMKSRWRVDELKTTLGQSEQLIVSTSSRVVRGRAASLARRRRVPLKFAPRTRG